MTAGCGREEIPPVPEHLRRLQDRELGCVACHDARRAPRLDPGARFPATHPPVPSGVARSLGDDG